MCLWNRVIQFIERINISKGGETLFITKGNKEGARLSKQISAGR